MAKRKLIEMARVDIEDWDNCSGSALDQPHASNLMVAAGQAFVNSDWTALAWALF